ncbi:Protein G6b [Fukomys damarensis]|uniref:Protein G6b n=1 Tax=Fukomys damarensis TaxID=885580 RepID=A0A091DE14_FUKDA|nr:Protein G6b [Fukomys damarensis]
MALALQLLPLLLSRARGDPGGSVYPQVFIPLLGAGLALGLGALGVAWWLRRRSLPPPLPPLPPFAPFVKAESQRPAEEEEEEQQEQEQREIPGDLDQEEPSLLYADLDYTALWGPRRLSSVAPTDASTVYAVVV